ncbi:hypothetical protein [Actinoallomurus acaciae]|uniref:Uncharacterized protein n=1 Tax=Actinoallomurus acaciae TaxID=502577 RepID=A0ABV5Y9J6_9ACTN
MSIPAEAVDQLRVDPKERYIDSPYHSERDRVIGAICRSLNHEDDYGQVHLMLGALSETLLTAYCQRMAVLAVREREPRWLVLGLRAAALASRIDDIRNVIIVLSLLWHSAQLIDQSAMSMFSGVADGAGRFGEALNSFAARDEKDKSLSAMMYSVRGDGAEFDYVCDW